MTEHPRLVSQLGRLRAAFLERVRATEDLRILLVTSGVGDEPGQRAMIDLANELAGRSTVFLCNALPGVMDPLAIARIDERIVLLEGTLGILPWTWDGDPRVDATATEAMSSRRAEVIRELIAFHEIKVVHSRGEWADRLVIATGLAPRIRWFRGAVSAAHLAATSEPRPSGAGRISTRRRAAPGFKARRATPRTIGRCRLIEHPESLFPLRRVGATHRMPGPDIGGLHPPYESGHQPSPAGITGDYHRTITGPTDEARLLAAVPWFLGWSRRASSPPPLLEVRGGAVRRAARPAHVLANRNPWRDTASPAQRTHPLRPTPVLVPLGVDPGR